MLLTLSEILLLNQRMSKYSSVEEEKAYYQTLAVLLERGSNFIGEDATQIPYI